MPRDAAGGGWIYTRDSFYIPLPPGAGQVSSILSLPRGFREKVSTVKTVVAVAAAGAGATRVLNIRKGNATGAVVATVTFTLADGATVGTVKDVPVTDGNAEFEDGDTLTVEWPAAGAVAFTAGAIQLVIMSRKRMQQID